MPDEVFKLPQSSYEFIIKVIQAYGHAGDKVSLSVVAQMLGTDPTAVSRNVGFLVSVGILEGGRDKGPTEIGTQLGRALEFDREDDVSRIWRDVLAPNPLIQRILSAIRVRGGMDATTLQNQVVFTAGSKKSANAMRGGAALIEMMGRAQLIREADGKFVASNVTDRTSIPTEVDEEEEEPVLEQASPVARYVQHSLIAHGQSDVVVRIDVQVHVQATVDDLPSVGDRINEMLERIGKSSGDGEAADTNPET